MYLNDKDSQGITVARRRWSPPSPSPAGSCPGAPQSSLSRPPPPSYDFYRAPFGDFPIIQSHLHPFCVIHNAGAKLRHKPYFTPPSHINKSDIEIVLRLHAQFTAPPPPTWGRDVNIASSEPLSDEEFHPRKRRRPANNSGLHTKKRRALVKARREIAQTIHTTRNGRGRRRSEHSSKSIRTLDTVLQ